MSYTETDQSRFIGPENRLIEGRRGTMISGANPPGKQQSDRIKTPIICKADILELDYPEKDVSGIISLIESDKDANGKLIEVKQGYAWIIGSEGHQSHIKRTKNVISAAEVKVLPDSKTNEQWEVGWVRNLLNLEISAKWSIGEPLIKRIAAKIPLIDNNSEMKSGPWIDSNSFVVLGGPTQDAPIQEQDAPQLHFAHFRGNDKDSGELEGIVVKWKFASWVLARRKDMPWDVWENYFPLYGCVYTIGFKMTIGEGLAKATERVKKETAEKLKKAGKTDQEIIAPPILQMPGKYVFIPYFEKKEGLNVNGLPKIATLTGQTANELVNKEIPKDLLPI